MTPSPPPSPTRSLTYTASPSFTPEPGVRVDLRIYSAAGELVAVLVDNLGLYAKPSRLAVVDGTFDPDHGGMAAIHLVGSSAVVSWRGANGSGQLVESGSYRVLAIVTDSFGRVETWSSPLVVIRSDLSAKMEVFNGAGEIVYAQALSATALGLALSENTVLAGPQPSPIKVTYGRGSGDYVIWAGTNQAGQPLASGTYIVKVSQKVQGGGERNYSLSVTVLNSLDPVFAAARLIPGILGPGQSSLEIVFEGAAPGTFAWAGIFSLGGERVGSISERPLSFGPTPAAGRLAWEAPSQLASGIYLIRAEAQAPSLQRKQAFLKFVILR